MGPGISGAPNSYLFQPGLIIQIGNNQYNWKRLMNTTSKAFLVYGLGVIAILVILSIIFVSADRSNFAPQFSLELTFADAMGTLLAVALALIAIGFSTKKLILRFIWLKKLLLQNGLCRK
jgi:hypothetical protein